MLPNPVRTGRVHRAWIICAAGALMIAASIGLNVNVFTIYQPHIIALNYFSDTQGSLITTVRSLLSLVGMLTVDWLCAKLGLRRTIALGIGLLVLSRGLFAAAHSFPVYCAGAVLAGLAYAWAGMIPLSVLLGHWFRDRRGLAIGLGAAGSGVVMLLVPPILNSLIETRGITFAFLLEGAALLVIGVIVVLLVRDRPEDVGLEAYHLGGEQAAMPPERLAPKGLSPLRWKVVLFSIFLLGGPSGPGFSHLTVLYTTEGYPAQTAAWLLAYMGLTLIIGKALYGQIADRMGGWRSNFLIGGLFTAALVLCALAPLGGMVTPVLAMTLAGLGFPISSVTLAVWALDLKGDAGYEKAVKWNTVAYGAGTFVFGPVPGMLADHTGSYAPAYWLFVALTVICMLVVQSTYHRLGLHRSK